MALGARIEAHVIAQMLTADLGLYYLVGLLFMLVILADLVSNPFINRLLGNPHPFNVAVMVFVLAFVWPWLVAEMINSNDRGRH